MDTDTAIAYFVFNRPEMTTRTFARIKNQRPQTLFVVADGPRTDVSSDLVRCAEVREIVSAVDWPCDVRFDFADENMGAKYRVSSGLDWVFSSVDRAIVLEDDCLAHEDFFGFCEVLLERYANDERVGSITGSNFQGRHRRGATSYYFSQFNPSWGWATWKRAWDPFDVEMPFLDEWLNSPDWEHVLPNEDERRYWEGEFQKGSREEVDAWDYPWIAYNLYARRLVATSNVNLVTNIGFGPDATHTLSLSQGMYLPTRSIGHISHPEEVRIDQAADRYMFDHRFGGRSERQRSSIAGSAVWALGGVGRRLRREWNRLRIDRGDY